MIHPITISRGVLSYFEDQSAEFRWNTYMGPELFSLYVKLLLHADDLDQRINFLDMASYQLILSGEPIETISNRLLQSVGFNFEKLYTLVTFSESNCWVAAILYMPLVSASQGLLTISSGEISCVLLDGSDLDVHDHFSGEFLPLYKQVIETIWNIIHPSNLSVNLDVNQFTLYRPLVPVCPIDEVSSLFTLNNIEEFVLRLDELFELSMLPDANENCLLPHPPCTDLFDLLDCFECRLSLWFEDGLFNIA